MSAEQLDASEAQPVAEDNPQSAFILNYDPKMQKFTPRIVGDMPIGPLLFNLSSIYLQLMLQELAKQSVLQGPQGGNILGPNGTPFPTIMGTFSRPRRNSP